MQTTRPVICIFAGSSMPKDLVISATSEALGIALGADGYNLICGGATGTMGIVAKAALQNGAEVTVVNLTKYAHEEELAGATTLYVATEAARFEQLAVHSQAVALFALPGGPGALREAMQGLERAVYEGGSPVVLVKASDYLDGISHYFTRAVAAGLIKEEKKHCLKEWSVGDSIRDVLTVHSLAGVLFSSKSPK